jgi:hypothetical protein
MQGDVPQIDLLDIPRLPSPPKGPFLRGLLTPWVLVAAAAILAPRLALVVVLLALRALRVGSYWLYAKAPGPSRYLTVIAATPLSVALSILMLPFYFLLYLNLVLSGFKDEDTDLYINAVVGPLIGTQD